jgi:hypothetical protein
MSEAEADPELALRGGGPLPPLEESPQSSKLSAWPVLSATYTGADGTTKEFKEYCLKVSSKSSKNTRVNYLDNLHWKVQRVQDTVNTFLTHKMQEEKGHGKDDTTLEANYGEEPIDDAEGTLDGGGA